MEICKLAVSTGEAVNRSLADQVGSASIAARNAQLEAEVTAGLRSPESLFLFSREQLKSATFVERAPAADGTGW